MMDDRVIRDNMVYKISQSRGMIDRYLPDVKIWLRLVVVRLKPSVLMLSLMDGFLFSQVSYFSVSLTSEPHTCMQDAMRTV